MKNTLVISLLLILLACGGCSEKDPRVILAKANKKCQEIRNGYYEMTKYMKYMTETDTLKSTYQCYFKKLDKDTLFQKAFHYTGQMDTLRSMNELYTGNELVSMNITDSSAEVTSRIKWPDEISLYSQNYDFYSPITDERALTLDDSAFYDYSYQLIGEEKVKDIQTYHVR